MQYCNVLPWYCCGAASLLHSNACVVMRSRGKHSTRVQGAPHVSFWQGLSHHLPPASLPAWLAPPPRLAHTPDTTLRALTVVLMPRAVHTEQASDLHKGVAWCKDLVSSLSIVASVCQGTAAQAGSSCWPYITCATTLNDNLTQRPVKHRYSATQHTPI